MFPPSAVSGVKADRQAQWSASEDAGMEPDLQVSAGGGRRKKRKRAGASLRAGFEAL
ncbi:MAG TPA: hypothetical protein VHE13_09655 [Opitutus sp.]|nr:hypothetical protein [Opitutus sp.]